MAGSLRAPKHSIEINAYGEVAYGYDIGNRRQCTDRRHDIRYPAGRGISRDTGLVRDGGTVSAETGQTGSDSAGLNSSGAGRQRGAGAYQGNSGDCAERQSRSGG